MGSDVAAGIARALQTDRAIAEALQKEREECARLLEAPFDDLKAGDPALDGLRSVIKAAANAIRARGSN